MAIDCRRFSEYASLEATSRLISRVNGNIVAVEI